ncbi:MAG: hypothetical protein KC613_03435, partial [Myxococcales bacterium]|nr:hypothetical protein [Myxococcales bacterium]
MRALNLSFALLGLVLTACAGADPVAECDGGPCGAEPPCTEGERRCLDNQPQTCIADGVWGSPRPCDGTCRNGSCEVACDPTSCLVGETRCALADYQTCEQGADGCGTWGPATVCPEGQTCSDGACQGDCGLACQPGDTRCASFEAVARCVAGAPCAAFGQPEPCPAGTACSDGACRPPEDCVDACPADGRVVCLDATRAQTCQVGPTG